MKRKSAVVFFHFQQQQPKYLRICDLGIFLIFSLLTVLPQIMAGKQELQAVIQGNGLFTKQLYNILSKETGNVFFSPISAHAVLAMAFQGAEGSTYDAFVQALGVSDSTQASTGYKDVLAHLNNISNVQLLMANKIYLMQGHTLKPSFSEVTKNKFSSEVESVNFADSAASAKNINQWVETKTQDKIKDLISPGDLDSLTRLVLVNAIYFKGNWASQFDKNQTKTEKFYLNETESIDVQMMNKKAKYMYKEDAALDAKVLELPYSNPDVSLIVVLPNKRDGIAELEEKLANTDLTKITENMFKPEVQVKLPKFKIETTIELVEPLKKMGLSVIFDQNAANFSGMLESPEPLYVSKVVQKAFIEVNEEGTEAAAATGVVWRSKRAIDVPRKFFVDRPFICVLSYCGDQQCENESAGRFRFPHLLFYGRISRPTSSDKNDIDHDEL